MLAQSHDTTRRTQRANQRRTGRLEIVPTVTSIKETSPYSNAFDCHVESRSNPGQQHDVCVDACFEPESATCSCPGGHFNCAHKRAAIARSRQWRANRWAWYQKTRRNEHGSQPLAWMLGNESALQEGA